MKTVEDIKDLRGKKVFVRLELDVPMENGKVRDDFRIRQSLPTLEYLKKAGAKIILAGHIGRDPKNSLRPVFEYMKKLFPISEFITNYFSEESEKIISSLKPGEAVLLENLRSHPEEEKNDESFAKKLASLGDLYVNESFAVSHRAHASIVGVPKYIPGYAGLELANEVKNLSKVFKPFRPFLFILGGVKFETKIPLIKKFLKTADSVFVGGALANNYFKELGYNIGESLISQGDFDIKGDLKNSKLVLPRDVIASDGKKSRDCLPTEVKPGEKIWDAGPETVTELGKLIANAKCILWNGPLGNYELGFVKATYDLTKFVAQSGVETIVGGGDTLASIKTLSLEDKFTFVSTGGGAMLEFLSNETLVGIEALENSLR